jgi:hypothetical protein
MANTQIEAITAFRAADYGPTLAAILADAPLNELGPGKPMKSMSESLRSLSIQTASAPHRIIDATMAQACLAGLWLRFDFLDESHSISQSIHNPTGSFWHAIMHRREPDYGNSKYWFRQVSDHPIFVSLCSAARDLAAATKPGSNASFLARQNRWDAFRFVDLVESSTGTQSTTESLCREIQRREWELLFDYCYAKAIGRE